MKPNHAHTASMSSLRGAWAIIRWELARRRWSILWWAIGIGAFISLTLLVYPSFRDQSAQIDQSLQKIPDSAKALFTDTNDFLSPVGYLSSQVYYLLLPLLFSFLAIGLGASLIAREEQQHTIELLLSRPVSRTALLFGKAAAGLLVLLAVGVVVALLGAVEVHLIGFAGVTFRHVLAVTMMALLLALLFGAVAFAATAAGRFGRGASIGLATLFALGGYIVSSLESTVHWLRWPAKVLPFHYYHPAELLRGQSGLHEAAGMVLATAVLLAIAWLLFRRRDIN